MSSERGFLWGRYIRTSWLFWEERIKMQRSAPFNMKVDIVQVVIKTLYANLYIVPSVLFISERGQYID